MPDDARQVSQDAHRLAVAVDQAVTAALPSLVDLQVAANPNGVVVLSGQVSSEYEQRKAEEVARMVPGVSRVIGSLTVA